MPPGQRKLLIAVAMRPHAERTGLSARSPRAGERGKAAVRPILAAWADGKTRGSARCVRRATGRLPWRRTCANVLPKSREQPEPGASQRNGAGGPRLRPAKLCFRAETAHGYFPRAELWECRPSGNQLGEDIMRKLLAVGGPPPWPSGQWPHLPTRSRGRSRTSTSIGIPSRSMARLSPPRRATPWATSCPS